MAKNYAALARSVIAALGGAGTLGDSGTGRR